MYRRCNNEVRTYSYNKIYFLLKQVDKHFKHISCNSYSVYDITTKTIFTNFYFTPSSTRIHYEKKHYIGKHIWWWLPETLGSLQRMFLVAKINKLILVIARDIGFIKGGAQFHKGRGCDVMLNTCSNSRSFTRRVWRHSTSLSCILSYIVCPLFCGHTLFYDVVVVVSYKIAVGL